MFLLIWFVLCLAGASLLLLPLALWQRGVYRRFSGGRLVACPEDRQSAAVSIDAMHAALTGVDGQPDVRLADCSRWPERSNCNRACVNQAIHAKPYAPRAAKVRRKQIYHLPILLAAFAAWYAGLIWHAQFVFRPHWLDAIGLTRAHAQAWSNEVHLLMAAACLLLAYGVASLLTLCHRKGVLYGILMSALLCGAVLATNWYGIATLPHGLLAIEAGYIALAALIVGIVVGGLHNKLVRPSRP